MERNLVKVGNREVKKRYIGNKLIFEDLSDKTEILSGTEIFTDKADENSVVHVEMDGKSYQNAGSGKNLINQNKTRLPPIVSIEGTEYYKVFGVRDVATITFESFFKTNTQYTIQFLGLVTTYFNEVFVEYVGGGSQNKHFTHATLDSLTTRSGETVSRIIIDTGTAAAFGYIKVDTFQLEEGIVATSYEPPAPSPDYPIEIHSLNNVDVVSSVGKSYSSIEKINLLLDEPLRSIGDVKDRLFRDVDGLWKIERHIAEALLDGSYNYETHNPLVKSKQARPRFIKTNNYIPLVSDRFKTTPAGTWDVDEIGIMSNDGTQVYGEPSLRIPINAVPATYFNANKTKLLYGRETPIVETLPQSLQDKLNNLRSFQDSNYIYTIINDETDILPDHVAENLKPTLHTTFKSKGWYDYYKKTLLK